MAHQSNLKFKNLTAKYKVNMAGRHSKKTKEVVYPIIEKWLAPHFGKKDLSSITVNDVNRFLVKLRRKNLAENRIYNIFATLKAIFNKAKKWGDMSYNPCDSASNAPMLHKAKAHVPTISEAESLLKAIFNPKLSSGEIQNSIILLLIITTGLRFGDISRLTWQNVDLVSKKISYSKRNFSSTSHYEFEISPILYKFLLYMKHKQKAIFKTLGIANKGNLVFSETFNGGNFSKYVSRIKYTSLYGWAKTQFSLVGIPSATLESLRGIDRGNLLIPVLPLPPLK